MSIENEQKKAAAHDVAVNKSDPSFQTFEGKFISVIDNKLIVRNNEGKEHSHLLAKNVKVTCDGTDCTVENLKFGRRIRVTTKKDDRNVAISVESLDKNVDFAPYPT
jgi:hypothetical protein